ncbi:MAG: Shedu immune nuclease family protein [Thermodesulfobacteriota bacterium]
MCCTACAHLENILDLSTPYVERTCAQCGRKINLREPGDNGHGIKVEKGDQFKFPNGWLQLAANPLKGTGHLTKHGLGWFAKLIFVEEIKKDSEVTELLEESRIYADKVLEDSVLLADLNLESEDDAKEAIARVEKDQSSLEWWALLVGTFSAIAKDAVEEQDAKKAAWATRALERCRSMCVFKTHLEEVVWMGHSAGRLVEVLKKWYANTTNGLEAYWQQLFKENPYVLSQLFSVPVVFIGDNAYVGGMNIDRQDAKFVDYLYATDSSNDAILVELKTPVTKLLGSRYRKGVFKPSSELSGSVVQALDYRRELSRNVQSLLKETDKKIDLFNPRCVVVAGDAATELDTEVKRRSFELYRSAMKDVEIVTYDELFKKAEVLATLFNLNAARKKT